jgi:DNA-binding NarL/FixJ family response regulator
MTTTPATTTTTMTMNSGKKKRILLVDDEHDIIFSLRIGLENNGFAVDTFNDPEEALSNFKAGLYDLLLIDAHLVNILRYNYRFVQLTRAFAHQMSIYHSYFQGPFFFVGSVRYLSMQAYSIQILFRLVLQTATS